MFKVKVFASAFSSSILLLFLQSKPGSILFLTPHSLPFTEYNCFFFFLILVFTNSITIANICLITVFVVSVWSYLISNSVLSTFYIFPLTSVIIWNHKSGYRSSSTLNSTLSFHTPDVRSQTSYPSSEVPHKPVPPFSPPCHFLCLGLLEPSVPLLSLIDESQKISTNWFKFWPCFLLSPTRRWERFKNFIFLSSISNLAKNIKLHTISA